MITGFCQVFIIKCCLIYNGHSNLEGPPPQININPKNLITYYNIKNLDEWMDGLMDVQKHNFKVNFIFKFQCHKLMGLLQVKARRSEFYF